MIFAISLGKQPHYIMPSYPVVALLVALLFEEVLKRAGVVPRLVLRIWGVLLGAMASGLAVLSFLFLTRVLGNLDHEPGDVVSDRSGRRRRAQSPGCIGVVRRTGLSR